jgi:hypothetical protein
MDYFAHVRSTSHPDPELAFNVQVGTLADPGNRAPRGFVNFVVGRYATGYATTFFRRNAAGSASSEPPPVSGWLAPSAWLKMRRWVLCNLWRGVSWFVNSAGRNSVYRVTKRISVVSSTEHSPNWSAFSECAWDPIPSPIKDICNIGESKRLEPMPSLSSPRKTMRVDSPVGGAFHTKKSP